MDMSYCRLCAEMKLNVELIAIFNESSNLHHIIVQCFQILINSNDNLPKMVCSNCCKQTLSFYEFYQRLQRAQQILQNLFNKGGVNHENKNDIKTASSCKNENESRLQTDGSANDNFLLFNIKNEYPFTSEMSSSDHPTNNTLHTSTYNNFSSTELSNIKKISNDLSDESISDNKSLLENGNDELKEEEVDDKDAKVSENKVQKGKKITVFKDHLGEEWKDYVWRCNICADEFKKKKKIEKHFTDEHGKTVEYECEDCSDSYISFDEFKKHVSTHREIVEYRCKSCDEWFLSSLRYKRHMYNTHGESETLTSICSICGKSYKTVKSLKDHIRIIHEGVSEEYECDICHKKYDRKTSLYIHKRKHEDDDYSYDEKPAKKRRSKRSNRESDADEYFECNLCHKSFAKSSTLNRHKKKHQTTTKSEWQLKWEEYRKKSVEEWKDYVWSCNICNEDMKTKGELEKHFKEIHDKPVAFLCIECQKTFPKFVNFKKHVRRHRFFAEFRCKLCNKWFASDSHLKRHTLTVHEIKTLNYVCPTCGKRFKTSMSLNYHKRYIHESTRDYECDICHKKYTSPVGLNNHKHSHKVGKAYQCELCGLNVSSKGNLDVHMLYKHTDTKDNPGEGERCQVCSKIFKTRIHLYRHNRRVHNAVRYECKICGKSCSDKTSFNLHLTIHTGELPHECNYCQKKFRLRKSLKIHIRQHTGEKPHHCDKCSHSFTDYANYLKHMKRKHGYLTRHDLDVTKQQHQPGQQQQHQQLPQQQLQQQQLQQR